MPYDNIISRSDAAALIPEEVAAPLLQGAAEQSAALTLFRRVPMSRAQTRIPVIAALPTAYFVNGDTGLKQTTEVNWTNKYLNAEEIAAIVPIPESVLDDTDFDVWGSIRPLLEEAVGRAMDAAVFFGVNKPASWPTDLVAAAIAAGNAYTRGTNNAAAGGIAEDINQLMGLVEDDGYDVSGFFTRRTFRKFLRGARATDGQKILDVSQNTLEGQPVRYGATGLWPASAVAGVQNASLIAGDFTQGIVAVRQDVTYKILDQAVIQDNTGAIVYNLAQQDMVAMRVVARFAWQVPNPINRQEETEADRYPFAVLREPANP